jgi:hypothetical protein
MIPGFTAFQSAEPAVRLAGVWDGPKECRPLGTETFCTGLVMWCKDVFLCPGTSVVIWQGIPLVGTLDSRTPYPCGVCVGITSPDDW